MGRKTVSVKVISFDLDGTLVDHRFVDSVWLEGIPRIYSVEKRVSFEDARKAVKSEYDKVGSEELQWYDLHHWTRKFNLGVGWRDLFRRFDNRIKTYPEVPKVLEKLEQRGFKLVIITNASREFLEFELEKAKIGDYFSKVFSSTSDFRLVKKTVDLYQKVCDVLEIPPRNLVHVGDDWQFDYNVPRRLGISAFYLDRSGKKRGKLIIWNLEELESKLRKITYTST